MQVGIALFLDIFLIATSMTVVDPSGSPLGGVIASHDDVILCVSDENGKLEFPPGTREVTLELRGYFTWNGMVKPEGTVVLKPSTPLADIVITVFGNRNAQESGFISKTILRRKNMRRLGVSGLGALQEFSPGVFVREYGGAMPVVSLSLRGGDPAHTGYTVQGHDITSAMDGTPGVNMDPLVFSGMRISRGCGSPDGVRGLTGTVDFIPGHPSDPPEFSASAADDGSGWLFAGISLENGRLAASLRRNRGTGETGGYSATLLINGSGSLASYGLLCSAAGGETQGPSWSVPSDGYRKRLSLDAWYRAIMGGLVIHSGLKTGRHQYACTVPIPVDDTHDEVGFDLGVRGKKDVGVLDFEFGTAIDVDGIRSTAIGSRSRLEGNFSTGAEYSGFFSLAASASANSVPGTKNMLGAGLSAGIPFSDSILVIGTRVSRGFRRPTMNDLYWPEDAFAAGNPDLRPESSSEYEATVSVRLFDTARLYTSGFVGWTSDLIRWEPGEGGKWTPKNVARVFKRGLEMEGVLKTYVLDVSANLTLMEVLDDHRESLNYGKSLPYVPGLTWSARAEYGSGGGFQSWTGMRGTGVRFTNYSQTSWLPAYSVISAGVGFKLPLLRNPLLECSVDNLLDEQYLETSGFEGKGRVLRISATWSGR